MKLWENARGAGREPSGRFDSNGVSLAYERLGAGPPVVLVHGFASSFATNWMTPGTVKALTEAGFSVAGFDHRGHGHSDRPSEPGAYRLEVLAADVVRFIEFLGLAAPVLVGYSMGARVVLRLLTTRPGLAQAAVLGGIGEGAGRTGDGFAERIAAALLDPDPRALRDPIARRFRQFADHQGGDLRALAQCIREVAEPVDLGALARLDLPVLVLAGAKDDQIENPAGLAARIPGASAQIIPDRNHNTVVSDARFKQAMVTFLKALG
jgi:pimeloyl-ACP methyl ester carboxylesterase